ncbi:MAG: hypothetical protein IJZ32_05475 [Clostridia bacterium]|nr:hypothetical protein [Clostridia bacterium]
MKKLWIALLACMSFVCMSLGVACSKEDKTKLAFNEGYLEEIVLGEPIMLDEYIDPNLTNDYTAILTCDETGQERDLKELVQWTTDKPGTYTLTYTVNSGAYKGTVSTKINVVVSKAEWSYSNPTLVYRAGDTMSFNLLKRNLNIAVKSYYDFEFFVKEVAYNNKAEDLRGKTSYTFPEHGDFVFTFGVKTKDGQVLTAEHTITVRKQQVMAAGAQEWMEENNITVDAEGWTYISPDGYVELDAGYYNGSAVKDHVPYLAFNGEAGGTGYGANTYVMADFTGKNLPQVAFFSKDVKPSFTDGGDGVLFYNGFGESKWKNSVHPDRLVVYGPNKVGYGHFDNMGRLVGNVGGGNPCPASWNGLDEDCQYRYIVGIENATTEKMTLRILLINLTTSERVLDYTTDVNHWTGVSGTEYLKDTIDESYYSGSIVLYGRYGFDLTLDKVYTPITGVSDIYELDQAAEFKDGFAKYYDKGDTANIADYAEISDGDTFRVVDPEGQEVTIDSDGNFTYTKSGTYRLYFIPSDVNIRQSSATVKVMYDLDSPMAADQLEKDGALAALTGNQIAVTNTVTDYIEEGAQSIRFYTINASETLDVYLTREFTEFVFMNRKVQGVKFDIYSPNAIEYKLKALTDDTTNAAYLREDYTGAIAAETWTTVTLSRDLIMKNYATYGKQNYAIALTLVGSFTSQTGVYVDNVQLVLENVNGTVATEAQSFMTANNITAYAYNSINADMSVSLKKGYYQGNPTHGAAPWMSNDDVPYIAYNGNYGAGSYVVADFTGKNIPQLCFFAKEITSSLTDGKAGIYVHTGMVYPNGDNVALHDSRRVTFFGPNKIAYGHIDNQGRLGQFGYNNTEGSEAPFSVNQLVEGTHYRYVIGVKSAAAGNAVFELLLINLDTNEKVAHKEHTASGSWGADFVSGNIVMYGRYNYAITLDKIYDVYENVSDINAIDKVSEVLGA